MLFSNLFVVSSDTKLVFNKSTIKLKIFSPEIPPITEPIDSGIAISKGIFVFALIYYL